MMRRILQQDQPDDHVCATGEMHTVREFCEHAFEVGGASAALRGRRGATRRESVGRARVLIEVSPEYFRPAEVEQLLGWKPQVTFKELVRIMVEADWELAKAGR